MTMYIHNL